MAVKHQAMCFGQLSMRHALLVSCTMAFSMNSLAGFERFWPFHKAEDSHVKQTTAWDDLNEAQQKALLKRYQELKEIPESDSIALQQRMEWFIQLSEQDKQQMRETWQKMSTQERKDLRKRMQKASVEQRGIIRAEYVDKYQHN